MAMDKKGMTTAMIIVFIFLAFFGLLFIGMFQYGFGKAGDVFENLNFTLGNVSFQDNYTIHGQNFSPVYNATLRTGIDAAEDTVPKILSGGLLLGMVVVMVICGYSFRRIESAWMVLDLLIIIVAFIIAVPISQTYETFINIDPEFLTIFSTDLSVASKFILNLYLIVPVVGGLIMLATYGLNKKKEDENLPLDY